MGIVTAQKVYLGFHQAAQKVHVPGEAVQLGDNQGRLGSLSARDRLGQLRPLGPLTGLDLLERSYDVVLTRPGVITHAGLLCLQAEAGLSLLPSAEPIIWH